MLKCYCKEKNGCEACKVQQRKYGLGLWEVHESSKECASLWYIV